MALQSGNLDALETSTEAHLFWVAPGHLVFKIQCYSYCRPYIITTHTHMIYIYVYTIYIIYIIYTYNELRLHATSHVTGFNVYTFMNWADTSS